MESTSPHSVIDDKPAALMHHLDDITILIRYSSQILLGNIPKVDQWRWERFLFT